MRKQNCLSQIITIKEASQRYKLSDGYLRHLMIRKEIRGRKAGGTWLIDLPSLQEFVSKERKPGPKAK